MKGDFEIVRFHKRFGWIEISIFYALFIQCMYMLYAHVVAEDAFLLIPSGIWAHTWIGGLIASIMITFKFIIARFKKDNIYLYGQYIGPIGFLGWSLAHWTSLYNFYFVVLPHWNTLGRVAKIVPNSFVWAAIILLENSYGIVHGVQKIKMISLRKFILMRMIKSIFRGYPMEYHLNISF